MRKLGYGALTSFDQEEDGERDKREDGDTAGSHVKRNEGASHLQAEDVAGNPLINSDFQDLPSNKKGGKIQAADRRGQE